MSRAWTWSIRLVALLLVYVGIAGIARAAASDVPPHQMSEEQKLEQAKRLYAEGVRAFEMGDPQTAVAAWEEAYDVYAPTLHVFNLNIAKAALELGDCVKARRRFQRFLDLVPEHPVRADAAESLLMIERSGCAAAIVGGGSSAVLMGEDPGVPLVDETLEVDIDHQHAHGLLRQRFDNDVGDTIEGLFLFEGGRGTHVVDFAYWNGAQKIVGHVYERDVATRIYEGTVRRRRDPGLLVTIGDGSFRFTVFPIAARERKQVELGFERWLTRRGNRIELRVPVRSLTTDIDVRLHDERSPAAFRSPTHQIAVQREEDGDFRIRSGRSRPGVGTLVLEWTIDEPPAKLRGFVHRSSGRDAYLVLTMSPPAGLEGFPSDRGRVLAGLRLHTEGPSLRAVHPAVIPDLRVGEELVVVARVSGGGPLDVRITGRGAQTLFEAETRVIVPEQVHRPWVSRWWARRRVEFLLDAIQRKGSRARLIDEVLQLSLAYDIVTPFTAFLAMPESELMGDTAELMRDARAHKQQILSRHPDAAAIRGEGGGARAVGDDDASTAHVADFEEADVEGEPLRARRRGKGSAGGCASCRAGRGPDGPLGTGLGLGLGLVLLLRRRRRSAA